MGNFSPKYKVGDKVVISRYIGDGGVKWDRDKDSAYLLTPFIVTGVIIDSSSSEGNRILPGHSYKLSPLVVYESPLRDEVIHYEYELAYWSEVCDVVISRIKEITIALEGL